MLDVVTLGETMVLFSPESSGSLKCINYFQKQLGGAESNFAIGVARLGYKSGWISKVGNDPFGKYIVSFIRGEGVDASRVKVDNESPTGVFFKEYNEFKDPSVYYYRKGSAASQIRPEDIEEDYIASAKYLHLTGITPLLSDSAKETVLHAIQIAKKNNVKVSFDPNIRKKLCSEEKCKETILEILKYVDIFLPGYSEAKFLLQDGQPEELCKELLGMGPSIVAMKLGKEGCIVASNDYIKKVDGMVIEKVVDSVGAGDGFAAGFITGLLKGYDLERCGKLANQVGAIVTTVKGDVEGLPTMEELRAFTGEVEVIDR